MNSQKKPAADAAYPEYNMFGEVLPASGIYARPAAVFVDVEGVTPASFANTIPPLQTISTH